MLRFLLYEVVSVCCVLSVVCCVLCVVVFVVGCVVVFVVRCVAAAAVSQCVQVVSGHGHETEQQSLRLVYTGQCLKH